MGQLQSINLQPFIDKYDLSVFVETGTGIGGSLKEVLKYNFSKYFSIEINKQVFEMARKAMEWPKNVNLINDTSISGLKGILSQVSEETPILFWLDSHFPGADYLPGVSYFANKDNKEINLPLESELRLIKSMRPNSKDVIICDDVRIYQDGDFTEGSWSERPLMNAGNLDFAGEVFSGSHNLSISLLDQGYLFIEPK